ncbi:beta-1,4-xylosyltransferase IRX9-like [Prosopis cineraria]|uniref:beta-1,4-xylosyltransferase IRX9-like n=1 Tax=Prosopis cineraria TaxID=364024 RepID=UPI00240F9A53|nr:beta-1,4-xylosyltransferase IRX9-like [Prosopis cineraria]XP_054794637.1 beta-1,4-xylosyltransferase IRX9-like [Prosopis cineraria]
MASVERSKKKSQIWKKGMIHFSVCFAMGFFTGLAPTGKSSTFSSPSLATSNREFAPQPMPVGHQTVINANTSSIAPEKEGQPMMSRFPKHKKNPREKPEPELRPRKPVIIVTPTSNKLRFQGVYLGKLANTIKLVPPPLLWIVVEPQTESTELPEILRTTGIMYRHLVSKENFTDLEAELNHQRNLALKHIEHHRLSGIVHFAGLSNVYDLEFFHQLRDIEVFGTWPMAMLRANRKKVKMEGPVCNSSQVIGWHLRKRNNETDMLSSQIRISSLAFNSSILWDPERWGRDSPVQDTSQNSIKFVKQVILEDESKLKGIPADDCSKILLWRFNFHTQPTLKRQVLRISL